MSHSETSSALLLAPFTQGSALGRHRSLQVVRAMTKEQAHSPRHGRAYERILRYPDGDVRRIRYPHVESDDDGSRDQVAGPNPLGVEREMSWDVPGLWGKGYTPGLASPTPKFGAGRAKRSKLPASPAELLKYLQSENYRKAERELQKRVKESYQVLEGCPWVFPRPLFVIALRKNESEAPMTYTLRTRISCDNTAEELSKLLRGDSAECFLKVGSLLDGVIAFQDHDDALRFRDSLEAEGYSEVSVALVDSHDLFRNTREVKAVVVCMKGGDYLPFPSELATSLRGQQSFDDD